MDLSDVFTRIQQNIVSAGWQPVVEDDYPDFKHLVCSKLPGLLEAFTRLNLLVMTPELNPADAAGICLCFLFHADPDKISDMRGFGKLIRKDDSVLLRQECTLMLQEVMAVAAKPSITIKTSPRFEKIRFEDSRYDYPAFFVELDYWMPLVESAMNRNGLQCLEANVLTRRPRS